MKPLALLPYYNDPCYEHSEALNRAQLSRLVVRSSSIDQARCVLLAAALESNHDVYLFIDGDIGFDPEGVEKVTNAAIGSGGIVGAPYATKEWPAVFVGIPQEKHLVAYSGGRIYRASKLGLGFTAIHRSALEKMVAAFPPVQMSVVNRLASPLCQPMVHDGKYWPEDQSFCMRAAGLGIPVFLDTRPRLVHYGRHGYRLEQLGTVLPERPTLNVTLREE